MVRERSRAMTAFWQDFLYGIRMLVKKPGFTVTAGVSVALGIAANTVIFSLINTTLLRPLTFPEPDGLMAIWTVPLNNPDRRNSVNVPGYLAWKQQARSFTSMGGYFFSTVNLGAEENGAPAERVLGFYPTPSLFETLGIKTAVGRVFTEEEGQ